MKREEAMFNLGNVSGHSAFEDFHITADLINRIYDDFEEKMKKSLERNKKNISNYFDLLEQSCENCNKRHKESNNSYCRIRERVPVEYQENFSCSEWKQK